jgi:hypothetical protein
MVRNGATCFAEFSVGDQSIDELFYVRFGDLFCPMIVDVRHKSFARARAFRLFHADQPFQLRVLPLLWRTLARRRRDLGWGPRECRRESGLAADRKPASYEVLDQRIKPFVFRKHHATRCSRQGQALAEIERAHRREWHRGRSCLRSRNPRATRCRPRGLLESPRNTRCVQRNANLPH